MSFTVIFCPDRLAKILLLMAGWWYSVLNCTSPFSLSSTSIVHVSKGSCTQVRKNNFYWCVTIYCKGNGMALMLGTLLIYRVDNHTGNCTELHTYLMNARLEYSNLESRGQGDLPLCLSGSWKCTVLINTMPIAEHLCYCMYLGFEVNYSYSAETPTLCMSDYKHWIREWVVLWQECNLCQCSKLKSTAVL